MIISFSLIPFCIYTIYKRASGLSHPCFIFLPIILFAAALGLEFVLETIRLYVYTDRYTYRELVPYINLTLLVPAAGLVFTFLTSGYINKFTIWPTIFVLIILGVVGYRFTEVFYVGYYPPMYIAASIIPLTIFVLYKRSVGYFHPNIIFLPTFLLAAAVCYEFYFELQRLIPHAQNMPYKKLITYINRALMVPVGILFITFLISGAVHRFKVERFESKAEKKYRKVFRNTHGSAEWFPENELMSEFKNGNIIMGENYNAQKKVVAAGTSDLLRLNLKGHLLAAAGTGVGKTTSVWTVLEKVEASYKL
ncbi:hypothetical protein COB52_04175 [Candidatus Kaiserbacteria bacterium]|nr:MAG: hypothetical protein COB52_04175 [Candidatus Kaiserbacteria bacterium]